MPLGRHGQDSWDTSLCRLDLELESLVPDVAGDGVDELGVQGAHDVPEEVAVGLGRVVEPLLRYGPVEPRDLPCHRHDPGDGELGVLGDAEAADLLVGEDGGVVVHDQLQEAQGAALQRREVELLQETSQKRRAGSLTKC